MKSNDDISYLATGNLNYNQVMYSGEYDACDVTLSVISTPGKLEKYA
jgi:hypothetical protein